MKRAFFKMHLFLFLIILLSACSNAEKIQHIEVFVIEIPNEGFMKVNSISIIEEGENYMKADTKAIEDYYDMEGNYIRTEIIHSTGKKTYISPVIGGNTRKAELQEPSTILIPDQDIKNYELYNLSEEEKDKVKKHILSFMDLL